MDRDSSFHAAFVLLIATRTLSDFTARSPRDRGVKIYGVFRDRNRPVPSARLPTLNPVPGEMPDIIRTLILPDLSRPWRTRGNTSARGVFC